MSETIIENPNFRLKAIAEFLDGKHHFFIPSYQRGYRWDQKQVEDLLKDIWDFAKNDEKKKSDFYCLQPVVVKENVINNKWIVIDGQQRLTTLLLLLNFLKKSSRTSFVTNSIEYKIQYATRVTMDFDNPIKDADIDSFHVYQSKKIIEEWFENNDVRISQIEDVLFLNKRSKNIEDNIPQVKVIWYVTENDNDIDSIKIFNNLNKGKIKLTNAELIKALFILKAQEIKNEKKVEELNIHELSYEWNEIENTLQDDRFWYFMANKDYNPATRIDLIFDFLTNKEKKDDDDFAYRKFQNLYDKSDDVFWKDKKVENFTEAWKKVKDVYHTFLYWYEDSSLYHYIGYLIYNGIPISTIYNECKDFSKSLTVNKLQNLIGNKLLNINKKDIDSYNYSENKADCNKLLLFFNIETCVKQQKNQNKEANNRDLITYYKFPFDLFKLNNWDIEHVGSQKDNPLKDVKDKIIWLSYIPNINSNDERWPRLKSQAALLSNALKEKEKDEGNKFQELYSSIISVIQKNVNDTKDTIDNLALLDSGTNRGYGNALFPTKRQTIIENDTNGVFIPVCTKNLFLKYYSSEDKNNSQWKNSWEDSDRKAYLYAIHNTIDFILK
jgi:uncharacterized protein with ParB-like and HNH nuclease domain